MALLRNYGLDTREGEGCLVNAKLLRTTLCTSRLLDFCSKKELVAQTGHADGDWPLVVLKELIDNALDACEEVEVAPEIAVRVDDDGIAIADNIRRAMNRGWADLLDLDDESDDGVAA